MEWLKTLYETLAGYAFRWRTRGGYVRVGAITLAAAWQLQKSAEIPIGFGVIGAGVLVTWTAVWLIGSGRLPIPPHDTVVVLAIDVDVEAERNFRRIFQTLRTALVSLPISRSIRLKRIAPDLVQDDKAAGRYLDNYGVAQVIWGRALAGKAQSKDIQKFELHWVQRVPVKVDVNAVISDLKLLEHGRKWTIADVNELIDVNIIAEDFLEISLAVIGILFLLESDRENAAVLFERVVVGLQHHSDPASARSKIDRFREILHQTQFAIASDAHDAGDHERAVAILENLLPSYPKDVEYRLTLARAHFLAGNTPAAVRSTDEIAKIDQAHPAVYANRAFFCVLNRKYKRAGEWYEKLVRSRREKLEVLTSVSAFLEERYAENPDEHAYLYGQAIVNGTLDPSVMRSDLERFVELTNGSVQYEPLRANARSILTKLQK